MVGLQTLDLAIGVRVPASQPNRFKHLRAAQKVSRPFCVPSGPLINVSSQFPPGPEAHFDLGIRNSIFAQTFPAVPESNARLPLPLAKAFESCYIS